MQFSILTVLAAFSASAYAGCYSGGASGTASAINPHVSAICDALDGSYVKNEQRLQCVMDDNSQQWNFKLKYVGSGSQRTIGNAECQNGMLKETACSHGGSTSYGNWAYTADPNAGSCYSD